ncbi:MFS transporter [Treponema zuelzerae]|uniref:MFS transporter n=1 Tax=Teretinema zuelzerae TaxID=156 RepID=A0AAE3EGA0_9SPIR|nr:MFS transporter [Teretinema zuelzerae]MCD1653625.1 MFS transporter [Teretinema zuelzerae]
MKMITRFSLYGFLKNFDFSEPFLILFWLSLGLNFFQIGILVAFQNVLINAMEIPSGAFADLYGRKTCMMISLASYVVSFILFAVAQSFAMLFLPLVFYAMGDAFRTGTHKAMIFDWLKINGRLDERTKVYGYTRSWSNYGSAFSVLIAAAIMIVFRDYRLVFWLSVVPGLVGLWNMYCYPDELNHRNGGTVSVRDVLLHTFSGVKKAVSHPRLRTLVAQNMAFEGCFVVSKDFIQPLLKAQVLVLASYIALSEDRATSLGVGAVYFVLHMVSAFTSRRAHGFVKKAKSENRAALILLLAGSALFAASAFGLYTGRIYIAIAVFVVLFILQNLWVPVNVAQYDSYSDASDQATILSVASQAKAIGVAVLAPLSGLAADSVGIQGSMAFFSGVLLLVFIASAAKKENR